MLNMTVEEKTMALDHPVLCLGRKHVFDGVRQSVVISNQIQGHWLELSVLCYKHQQATSLHNSLMCMAQVLLNTPVTQHLAQHMPSELS